MFLERLIYTLKVPSGIFRKFKFKFLVDIRSNTWWAKIGKGKTTVADAILVRPSPIVVPDDTLSLSAVDPPESQPGPWPVEREKPLSLFPPSQPIEVRVLAVAAVPARTTHASKAIAGAAAHGKFPATAPSS
jgi:hypothetical protein